MGCQDNEVRNLKAWDWEGSQSEQCGSEALRLKDHVVQHVGKTILFVRLKDKGKQGPQAGSFRTCTGHLAGVAAPGGEKGGAKTNRMAEEVAKCAGASAPPRSPAGEARSTAQKGA